MKKTSLFAILEIIFSAAAIVLGACAWILLQNGFLMSDNTEGAEAIGLVFAIIFFAMLSVLMLVLCLYMIAEGIIVYIGSKNNKTYKVLLIISGIVKLVACAPTAFVAIFGASTGFVVCVILSVLFIFVLCFSAIFGFVCAKTSTIECAETE